jgi:hypothetical protein
MIQSGLECISYSHMVRSLDTVCSGSPRTSPWSGHGPVHGPVHWSGPRFSQDQLYHSKFQKSQHN